MEPVTHGRRWLVVAVVAVGRGLNLGLRKNAPVRRKLRSCGQRGRRCNAAAKSFVSFWVLRSDGSNAFGAFDAFAFDELDGKVDCTTLFHGELCLKADRLQSQLKKVEEEMSREAMLSKCTVSAHPCSFPNGFRHFFRQRMTLMTSVDH